VHDRTGSDFFNPVVRLNLTFDAGDLQACRPVESLPHLRWLQVEPGGTTSLAGTECPSLAPLANCQDLEYLVLGAWLRLRPNGSPGWTGAGVTLAPLIVDSQDLTVLRNLKHLRLLALGGARLTDESINNLARLRQLKFLYLSHTKFSAEGLKRLESLLPQTTVIDMDDDSRDYAAEIDARF
jgi:hypothetical protein